MKLTITTLALSTLRPKLIASVCVTSLLLSMSACNENDSSDVNTADFDSEVYSHTAWSDLSPPQESTRQALGISNNYSEVVDTTEYTCTDDSYSLTETPREFVAISPDKAIMWLGNLIQGDSHLQVGSLEELSIRERAPMNISIDLLRGDNFRRIESPSLTSVNAAIGELIEAAVDAGHEASTEANFFWKEAYSTTQASLDLGFTAEYLGANAEASLSIDKQGEENTMFAYFIQNAFTVSMELPSAPHDLISDAFTQERLNELVDMEFIGKNNPPLYISSMSYGRVLIYKMTSTDTKERMQAAISASYYGATGGGSGYSEIELTDTLHNARIEIAAFGGNQSNIEAMIRSGQLKDYFSGDTKLTSMQPISFEIRNLQDNTIAEISRTTEYTVKKCTYVGPATPPIGEKIKLSIDKVYIPADCDAGISKGDIYGRFDIISFDNANNGNITRRIRTISSASPIKVQSGNDLNLGNSIVIDKFYGRPFEISAQLKDKDGGLGGADDLVGNWNANSFNISKLAPGSYTKTATNNCIGKQPVLYYKLERTDYIYP